MIFSIFESRRKLNHLIVELRAKGELNEANLRKVYRARFFVWFLLLISLFVALYCLFISLRAGMQCVVHYEEQCSDIGLKILIIFVFGAVVFLLTLKDYSKLLDSEFQIIYLMTHGERTMGIVNDFGLVGSKIPSYLCKYTFKDHEGGEFSGEKNLPVKMVQKKYKIGDDISISYDPMDPSKNVYIPEGNIEFYNLKIVKKELSHVRTNLLH